MMKKVTARKMSHRLESPTAMRPHIYLSSEEVKEVKSWEVGKTYKVALELKQVLKSEERNGSVSASFEVMKYKVL